MLQKKQTDSNRTLFFIAGPAPTDAERKAAEQLDGRVVFMNASLVTEDEKPEACGAVAALDTDLIPAIYVKKIEQKKPKSGKPE